VWAVLKAEGISGAGRNVALYLDEINLEAGVEITAEFRGAGRVLRSATPAGNVATTTHLGPYDSLYRAHDAIHRWCRGHGHAMAGPSWEVYGHWVADWNTDPSRIRTDVVYLLEPGARSGV
jgi:effector-binding domain-containing protein